MSHESDVTAFRKAFKLPIHEKPTLLEFERPGFVRWFKRVILRKSVTASELHVTLIQEEFKELQAALRAGDITEIFDALIDLQYVINGMGVHMGLPMEDGWAEVQRSNMSKLDENGEPIYREDGKVLKSDLYSPPNLQEIIDKKE